MRAEPDIKNPFEPAGKGTVLPGECAARGFHPEVKGALVCLHPKDHEGDHGTQASPGPPDPADDRPRERRPMATPTPDIKIRPLQAVERQPPAIHAVLVTVDNIDDVRTWCGGSSRSHADPAMRAKYGSISPPGCYEAVVAGR